MKRWLYLALFLAASSAAGAQEVQLGCRRLRIALPQGIGPEVVAEAIKVLEKVSRAEGRQSAGIHYHLGSAYAAAGRTRDAVTAFKTALKLDPNFAEAGDARAQLAKLEGNARP